MYVIKIIYTMKTIEKEECKNYFLSNTHARLDCVSIVKIIFNEKTKLFS